MRTIEYVSTLEIVEDRLIDDSTNYEDGTITKTYKVIYSIDGTLG